MPLLGWNPDDAPDIFLGYCGCPVSGHCKDNPTCTPCCGYGKCNIFCGNCDGGCREGDQDSSAHMIMIMNGKILFYILYFLIQTLPQFIIMPALAVMLWND